MKRKREKEKIIIETTNTIFFSNESNASCFLFFFFVHLIKAKVILAITTHLLSIKSNFKINFVVVVVVVHV